ncbi:MAG: c-type cytochrome [Flavobacteriaceae bacterium]
MKYFILSLVVLVLLSFTIKTSQQDNTLDESIERGRNIYNDFCITCHLSNGEGVKGVYPPLANSDYLKNIKASIKAVKFGISGELIVNGKKYNGTMTPLGLDDDEIADVINYINNSWGNKNDTLVTKAMVFSVKNNP